MRVVLLLLLFPFLLLVSHLPQPCQSIKYDRKLDLPEDELTNLLDDLLPMRSRINLEKVHEEARRIEYERERDEDNEILA
ncbi:unnamed protein product [Allacma fusca]|uniref:Uncharacterized protein n=1 Tax=Allacma fusca TaxID=39272 RepID=A0A8J2K4M9_9HEXA|nr:unnamed protein product [Allacma fusca]